MNIKFSEPIFYLRMKHLEEKAPQHNNTFLNKIIKDVSNLCDNLSKLVDLF